MSSFSPLGPGGTHDVLGPGGTKPELGPGGTRQPMIASLVPGLALGDMVSRVVKYGLEGLAVAIAAFWLPKFMGGKSLPLSQIIMISMVALATFALLDTWAPSVGASARTGAGFGIGAHMVGFP